MQRQAKCQQSKHTPQTGAPGIGPARARHPKSHAAPHGARRPITPRTEDRELAEGVEEQDQRNAGERLRPLGLNTDKKVCEIDRRQDGERKQKADQQLLGGSGIFKPMPLD